jgi:RNA polymerase sigma-70 factor (ECF subfamily)
MNEGEEAVVTRAAAGDEAAFGTLVEAHWGRLLRLARSVLGDAEAADAVQEGLLAAWRELPALRQPAAFPAWLTRVVTRRALARARRRAPWWRRLRPLADAADVAAPEAAGGNGEIDVARMLAALAPRQRAVMHLTVVEGMSDGEIGRALGIATASVRSHRRRARHRLLVLLQGDNPHAST